MKNKYNCNPVNKYLDISKLDLEKWKRAGALLGLGLDGNLTLLGKPNYTDEGNGKEALFDDGKYRKVYTIDEVDKLLKDLNISGDASIKEVSDALSKFQSSQEAINTELHNKDVAQDKRMDELVKDISTNTANIEGTDSKVETNKVDIQYIKDNYLNKDNVNTLASKEEVKAVKDITEVNRGLINDNRKDINSLLEGEDSYTHFRGLFDTEDTLKIVTFPKVNDFAYVEETHTKWQFNVDHKWVDTKHTYPRDTRSASKDEFNESIKESNESLEKAVNELNDTKVDKTVYEKDLASLEEYKESQSELNVKKLDKVYVDGSIQGDGTKNNPLSYTLPSEFEEILSYGVVFDGAEPKGIRVGNMDLHRKLPLQSQMRKCLLLDNGDVNYWLDPNNSLLKENGNSAILDGTDGQVMVFLPQFWYKVSNIGGGVEYRISEKSISGYTHSPACYISAYESSLMRDESILSSVVNNTANYRGGNNNAEWDEEQQSLLGKPATNISLTNFIKYASNRGADWYCNYYDAYKKMCFLYLVEYANRNSQAEFITDLTDEGFKQGGLGEGVTTLSDSYWSTFNGYNPFIPCGYTNSLGNNTGTKDFTIPSEYGERVVSVPSYRGIENPFGHIRTWTDGLDVFAGEETTRLEVNGKYVGDLSRDAGYIKTMLGEEIMPVEVGGGSTSYWCDMFSTNAETSQGRPGIHFGGSASSGSFAGLAYSNTRDPSNARAFIGSRLCFFKRA